MNTKKHFAFAVTLLAASTTAAIAGKENSPQMQQHQNLSSAFDQGRGNSDLNVAQALPAQITGLKASGMSELPTMPGLPNSGLPVQVERNTNLCKFAADLVRAKFGVPNVVWASVGGALLAGSAIAVGVTAGSIPLWASLVISGGMVAGLVMAIVFAVRAGQAYAAANTLENFCRM